MSFYPLLGAVKDLCKTAPQQIQQTACQAFSCCRGCANATAYCCQSIHREYFYVCLDVRNFSPNEIAVQKLNNDVIIEGNHSERFDGHSYISQHFTRRFILPNGYNADDLLWYQLPNGFLMLEVPMGGNFQCPRSEPVNPFSNWRSTSNSYDCDDVCEQMAKLVIE